jgi:Salmonella virulence plasmid 65kDa B protein
MATATGRLSTAERLQGSSPSLLNPVDGGRACVRGAVVTSRARRRLGRVRVSVAAVVALLASASLPQSASADVTPSGAYETTLPIEVPAFHGLEPAVALSYSSGRGNDIAGVGWKLHATSYVVRSGFRGGAPAYDGTDVFVFDGMELVACAAGSVSPSCTSGGTHSTKVESYQRIQKEGANWYVWSKDGTRSTYEPQAFSHSKGTYRWALAKRTDTHGNKVTYRYWCYAEEECYLERISYGHSRSPLVVQPLSHVRADYVGALLVSGAER